MTMPNKFGECDICDRALDSEGMCPDCDDPTVPPGGPVAAPPNPPAVGETSEGLPEEEIRRRNLNLLINHAGSVKEFALATGVNQTTVSTLRRHGRLSDKMARSIERCLELESGWMDRLHETGSDLVGAAGAERPVAPLAQPPEEPEVLSGEGDPAPAADTQASSEQDDSRGSDVDLRTYKIDDHIPYKAPRPDYPFEHMSVGQSFFEPETEDRPARKVQTAIASAKLRYLDKTNSDADFRTTMRHEDEKGNPDPNGKLGVRCWRVK